MKPTLEFGDRLLDNDARFGDPFFRRFTLRRAAKPLQLTETIAKDYRFPTLYADVTCAIGIFHCDRAKAAALLPHPRMKPVRMTRGRSLVVFSCYEYKNVMNVPPYNEIAMMIPMLLDPAINVPVLPMVASGFKRFGYYVFSMPVTSKENQIRGTRIWGLPKVTREIDVVEDGADCVTTAREEDGTDYFELRVPMTGSPSSFDVTTHLYSGLDGRLLKSQTNFKGDFRVTKFMKLLVQKGARPDHTYLKLGNGPSARRLRELDIEEHPFQLRFARHVSSAFDLPDPGFAAPAGIEPLPSAG